MTTTPDTLPRTDVLAAVRAAWYEAARDKHGNPIIALTTVLRVLGMGEHVTVKDGRAVLVNEARRTPEVVLRAMVHAYQDAAVEAEAEVFREQRNGNASIFTQLRMFDTQKDAANMRAVAATFAAEGVLMRWLSLHTDYEARLAGTVPLDAPPRREP